MRLLLAEDSKYHRNYLVKVLREEGYSVDTAVDGKQGLALAIEEDYDGIILDVMMPVLNGFELLTTLRKQGNQTPIMVISALTRTCDRKQGRQLGANDYLVKPFSLEEVLGRVRALVEDHVFASSFE